MSKRLVALVTIGGLLGILSSQLFLRADKVPTSVGKKIANFTLTDPRDQSKVSLADFKDKKAVVVLFLGTECPINNNFMPRLAELHKEYSAKGVQFLAVNSNAQDTAERVAAHAKKYAVPFPVLKDEKNVVADQLGAKRNPEAFLLDAEGKVRYQGRIDDQYGFWVERPKPSRRDLAEAIDQVLAGKEVAQPTTEVAGCLIGRAKETKVEGAITYAKDVAKIVQNRCQDCHRPGQIGPMSLLTYEQAKNWSDTICEVVADNRMPPWLADSKHSKAFRNDRSLTKEEKDTLLGWIAQGCPKGDDKDMPPAREFAEGWRIGKPDMIFTMEREYPSGKAIGEGFEVPAEMPEGGVPYKYFVVDTNFKEDKWIVKAEAKAGAPEVVHHIIAFVSPPNGDRGPGGMGRVLVGTAPGDMPLVLADGYAKRIPAGSKLIFQMHYTPNGKAQKDRSSVGLIFRDTPPEREAYTIPVANNRLKIPPGDDNHKVESEYTFKEDGQVLGFMPHMHLRGKDFFYEAVYPDGKTEVLLTIPRYNFNWQNGYRLAKPVAMPKGSKVHCVAHFDNSARNPNNPDATKEVVWGDQTWEEMMIGWTEIVFDKKPQ